MGNRKPTRILITGSREFTDWRTICHAMLAAASGNGDLKPVVVHGCSKGADFLAAQQARKLCWDVEDHPANWRLLGKNAGFIRNAEMVFLGADVCLAFFQHGAGNKGTSDCVQRAREAGIPTRIYWNEDTGAE